MAKKKEKSIFPFKPNAKVQKAFNQKAKDDRAIRVMMECMHEITANIENPFGVLAQEHPEIKKEVANRQLRYCHITETICVVDK